MDDTPPDSSDSPENTQPKRKTGYRRPPVERQFKPGQSGNPSGRPKMSRSIESLSREYSEEAVHALGAALKDPRTRVAAAMALLDRGFGKPSQTHELKHSLTASVASDADLIAIAFGGSAPVIEQEADTDEPDGVVH